MPNTVTLEHAKAHLEDLIAGAGHHEGWLVVGADGKPMGTLSVQPVKTDAGSAPNTDHSSLFGLMPGIKLLPGWDDPLDEFEEYM